MLNIRDRIKIKSNVKFFKNRFGKIVDSMFYNDKQRYRIILDNYANGEIPLWFYKDEIEKRGLYSMIMR